MSPERMADGRFRSAIFKNMDLYPRNRRLKLPAGYILDTAEEARKLLEHDMFGGGRWVKIKTVTARGPSQRPEHKPKTDIEIRV